MIRCVVSDTETEPSCSNYLTREKDFELQTASSEDEIIECYKDFKPNVFILNFDNPNMDCISILDNLTHSFPDICVSNIIILYNDFNSLENINISKVSMLIPKPFSETTLINSINKVIKEKYEKRFLKDELHQKVFTLQNKINMPDTTTGTLYLRKAIRCCYREPETANKLNEVNQRIAFRHNITTDQVQWDIRSTINTYKQFYPKNEVILQEMFGSDFSVDDLTPKRLIRHMTSYLRLHFDDI